MDSRPCLRRDRLCAGMTKFCVIAGLPRNLSPGSGAQLVGFGSFLLWEKTGLGGLIGIRGLRCFLPKPLVPQRIKSPKYTDNT
jgi:hypothetical protein